MKVAAFTACNEKFYPLLDGMMDSLFVQVQKGLKRVDRFNLTVFSDGLTDDQFYKLEDNGVQVVDTRNFDLSVSYPAYNTSLTDFPACYTIRPLLPAYARDADACVWIDADIWFQDERAVEHLIWALHYTEVAAVPVEGRIASFQTPGHRKTVKAILHRFFGEESSLLFADYPVLNMGFWGMKTNSRLWKAWQENLNLALKNCWGDLHFGVEESAFNYTVYKSEIPIVPLPYVYNCSIKAIKDMVVLIDGKLCVGMVPFEEISAVHLSYLTKWNEQDVPILDRDGRHVATVKTKLDYHSMKGIT